MPKEGTRDRVAGVQAPTKRIILNFPVELAELLARMAKEKRRPLTRQVQVLVERALGMAPQ